MKTAVGIIGLVLSMGALMQSCAIYGLSGLAENKAPGEAGALGILTALMIFFAGAFSFGLPKVASVLFLLGYFLSIPARDSFPDMRIWGSISLILSVLLSFEGGRKAINRMSKHSTHSVNAKNNQGGTTPANTSDVGSCGAQSGCMSGTTATQSRDWTSYFTGAEWAIYVSCVVVGLILRWTLLDMRPYHHDESLHGQYGGYFYDWPNSNYYKYDPMLHGPMLYNSMRFIYAMFGDSLWAARTPVCIMGSLFIFVPFLFRNYFKSCVTLLLTGTVAISPTMVYWSRFLREDYWVISGMLLTLFGFTIASRGLRPLLVLLGLTIQWCTKENVFVTVAIVLGYFVFEAFFKVYVQSPRKRAGFGPLFELVRRLRPILLLIVITSAVFIREINLLSLGLILSYLAYELGIFTAYWRECPEKTEIGRVFDFVRRNFILVCVSFFACAAVFCWFYGAGGRYPDGILDGLGGKAIEYWADKHNVERIKGPFNFHVYVTAWYELPVFVALLVHMALFYRRAAQPIQFAAACVAMLVLLSWIATDAQMVEQHRLWRQFKLKNRLDILGLLILPTHALLVTVQHLLRNERVLAATGYFATATFFSYSYLGEKVPWLSVYPLVFLLPYLALFFQDYFQKYPMNYKRFSVANALLIVGCITQAFGMIFYLEQIGDDRTQTNENFSFLVFGMLFALCGLVGKFAFRDRDSTTPLLGTMHLGRWATVIVAIFTLRASIQTNYLYAGKETEYLSQVHTTYELAEYAKDIIDQAKYERNGFKPKVFATGDATWPLTWYFRRIPEQYRFTVKDPEEKKEFAYLFISWKEKHDPSEIPEGYIQRRVNLRGWWVPDFNQISLKKFMRYAINHYPWNPSGFSYATLLTAKDMERFRK